MFCVCEANAKQAKTCSNAILIQISMSKSLQILSRGVQSYVSRGHGEETELKQGFPTLPPENGIEG
jgi:hypothetical protein